MISDEWKGAVLGSLLGAGHGPLVPDTLYGAWLDSDGDVIAMSGLTVDHSAFEVVEDQVVNTVVVDAGLYPDAAPTFFALAADGAGESVYMFGVLGDFVDDADDPVTPVEGDGISFDPGELALVFTESS